MARALAIVIPTRGRPDQCANLVRQIAATAASDPIVVLAVDLDDPDLDAYWKLNSRDVTVTRWTATGHVAALNNGAAWARQWMPKAIVKLDDDHWPVTPDWDAKMLAALDVMTGGIVYGDDLLQGECLPTAPAISTSAIEAWGWMGPPCLTHMFVDNFWRDVASVGSCLRYLPDVVIEHRHHLNGKAPMDEGYERTGTQELFDRDEAAYKAFKADPYGMDAAVNKLRSARVS